VVVVESGSKTQTKNKKTKKTDMASRVGLLLAGARDPSCEVIQWCSQKDRPLFSKKSKNVKIPQKT